MIKQLILAAAAATALAPPPRPPRRTGRMATAARCRATAASAMTGGCRLIAAVTTAGRTTAECRTIIAQSCITGIGTITTTTTARSEPPSDNS